MLFDPDNTTLYMIAGIIITTASLLLHQFKRRRLEAERQAKRRAVAEAAQDAERKRQPMKESVKIKPERSYAGASERVPLADLSERQFNGAYSPRNIAKWEAEIHQIGRQMIGTLDSKMVALQTLTQEANRAANRMELLLERFEQLAQFNAKPPQNKEPSQQFLAREKEFLAREKENEETPRQPEHFSGFIPAGTAELPAQSLVLNDFESELDRFEQQITAEPPEPVPHATILKIEESNPLNRFASTGSLQPNATLATAKPFTASKLPETGNGTKPSYYEKPLPPPLPLQRTTNLSFGSLYDDELAERERGKVFAVAAPAHSSSRLDLQKQVEMLHNYGYTPRQIAQSLNVTVGEVDLMLKLKVEN
ncbi:MAG: hypothetical protein LBQ50_12585 [Planctomycetaceae bacterium]|jgi:hypothetical protein|nr:hypothetical protein [Planctomycetaceae bacterium]